MPYNSDTTYWYSKYNKISYYIVTCNEYLWWIFGLEYTDRYNTNVTITEVVTLLSWIFQQESYLLGYTWWRGNEMIVYKGYDF